MFGAVAASPSRTFLAASLAYIAGTSVHAWDERPWAGAAFAFAACAAAVAAAASRPRSQPRFAFLAAATFLAALARFDAAVVALPGLPAIEGRIAFRGSLVGEPKVTVTDAVLVMDRMAAVVGGASMPLEGRAEVRTSVAPAASHGDVLEWECAPAAGGRPDLERRQHVLYGVVLRCRAWEPPVVVEHADGRGAAGALVAAKRAVRRSVGRLIPEPEASFLMGLLAGERGGIPPDMAESFRSSGTAHILAVSGYNVSRVVDAAIIAFALAGVGRRRAALAAAVLVAAFAAAVGAEPSVVRAAIMGCVGLLADLLGRRYSGGIALIAAAAAMVAVNPFVLRHDLGFALSFSAVMGLHALAPPIADRLRWVPEAVGIRRTLAETLAATAATLPLVVRAFGTVPLASPLANVVILPFIPAAMGIGALAAALGAAWEPLGIVPAFIAAAILRGITVVSDASGRALPPIAASVGPAGVVASYAAMAAWAFACRRPDRRRRV